MFKNMESSVELLDAGLTHMTPKYVQIIALRLRMCGALPPLTQYAFMHIDNFTF